MGLTDSGERTLYYLILIKIDLKQKKNKAVLLINNGIHPGEPDGIDATMQLFLDLALAKIKVKHPDSSNSSI
jgi:hypothetical protein